MLLKALPLTFVLAGLALYTILGGADFGAGFWQLFAGRGERAERIRAHAHRSMGPVWEANHVWLIFVLTVFWTSYPRAFSAIASTLAVPLSIAALGIILRGAAYALRAGASSTRESGVIDTIFSVSSVLTPFALGAAIGAIATDRGAESARRSAASKRPCRCLRAAARHPLSGRPACPLPRLTPPSPMGLHPRLRRRPRRRSGLPPNRALGALRRGHQLTRSATRCRYPIAAARLVRHVATPFMASTRPTSAAAGHSSVAIALVGRAAVGRAKQSAAALSDACFTPEAIAPPRGCFGPPPVWTTRLGCCY